MHNYSNMKCDICQEVITNEILSDKRPNGKERPWAINKERSMYLAQVYRVMGQIAKAERVAKCSNWLKFTRTSANKLKLFKADFCRERLCPMCQWRRSLKSAANVARVVEHMQNHDFLMMTLTIKNVKADKLSETIDCMFKAWTNLFKQRPIKRAYKGYFRSFEIKHDMKRDDYHPHFHALIAVEKNYLTTRHKDYITTKALAEKWGQVLGVGYNPHCWLTKVKGNTAKAVAEVAKYAAKSEEYLVDDFDFSVELVKQMTEALAHRRLIGWGGVMDKVRKQLKLQDEEEGNLVNINDEETGEEKQEVLTFSWKSGYCQYFKVQ